MRAVAWIALVLSGLLALAVHVGWTGRAVPPDPDRVPAVLGPLRVAERIDVPPEFLGDPPPDRFLFARVAHGDAAEGLLYFSYYRRAQRWSGRPHDVRLCFAADGWKETATHTLRRGDGRVVWVRRFVRGEEAIQVASWLEQPVAGHGQGSLLQRLGRRLGRGALARQDIASVYVQFDADRALSDQDVLAASQAFGDTLRTLWQGS